ncbi:MAG TPA: RNA-binding cell elongation regulator Jag/EloR [Thermomicrobiales bacterium]|nr:RNA-binding cell elongation regulator Jag/EloR [Thermomicrobiales bacterium]
MAKRTSVEIQAVSVDEAVRLALDELGLGRDEVDIEVLSEEGPAEDAEALVRVTAKGQASQPEPRASREGRSSRPRRRGRGGNGNGSKDWLGGRTSPGDRPSRRGTPPPVNGAPRERVDAEQEQEAKQIVSELLSRMGVDAEVVAVDNPSSVPLSADDPPTIFIDILGRDLGMLIGRRGEHLSQLQYLVNTLVNRKLGNWTRVIIDIEGYRTRREESLVGLAERVARQVARSGRSIVLEPMPPNERRIIHLTLREHPDVSTHSSGEGAQRRITVEPAG